jgi:aminoglycoside 2''-phosphotransferase
MDTPQPYLARIRECLPNVPIVTTRFNRDGLMNDVVVLNEAIVVRFAKDEWARGALTQERAILGLIRHYVQLPTPHVEQLHGDVMIYPFIAGVPLVQDLLLRLPVASQEHMAEQLARFLGQLHRIPADALARSGIGLSAAARTDEDWERMYRDVERELFPHLWDHARAWVRRLFTPVLTGALSMAYEPVLIHGDLAGYHILHDPEQEVLTGVIDFGTAGLGDPATDFALLIQVLGESFLRRMLRYEPEIAVALDRARFRAAVLELEWALHGLHTNDVGWWTAHLGNARDALPMMVSHHQA